LRDEEGTETQDRVGKRNRVNMTKSLSLPTTEGVSQDTGLTSSVTGEVWGKPGQLVFLLVL